MFRKILFILILICISPIAFADLESTNMIVRTKGQSEVDFVRNIYNMYSEYVMTYSFYINTEADVADHADDSADYGVLSAYFKEYEWYNPSFINRYIRDKSPILISFCLAKSNLPDEPKEPIVFSDPWEEWFDEFFEPPLTSALDIWVDIKRSFYDFKAYKDSGGTLECWNGKFELSCYFYLDEDYMMNTEVIDYYGWDEDNPPNVKDVADISIFSNCDVNTEGSFCMVNLIYGWNVFVGIGIADNACYTNYVEFPEMKLGLWNATPVQSNEAEYAEGILGLDTVLIDNQGVTIEIGKGEGMDNGEVGYQYSKVRGYILETEISRQQQNYLGTILNIMKLLFSFLLLMFYLIEFTIIIYVPTKIVPSMYNKLLDIIKKAGNIG